MNAIEIENVTKVFPDGDVKALDRVSFSVQKGEIVGLLGANGAGKTTLISILIGLLTRDGGSIRVLGKDLDDCMEEILSRVNIVTGFTMVSISLTVREFLRYYARLYKVADMENKIERQIRAFHLTRMKDIRVQDLSSGYKQRLLLAKGLLNDPEIIYMDEPTVGLDVGMALRVRRAVAELGRSGTTILFTSHNLAEVEQLCSRIVLISKGKVIQIGTIEEIKERIRNNKLLEVDCKRIDDMLSLAKGLKDVKEAKIVGGKVVIEARKEGDVDGIIRRVVNSDHIILSIRKIEPTLEEAFLNIVNGE
jgi:ABC-2 type transport system ATP-binding protein